jgi:hypothetical protein
MATKLAEFADVQHGVVTRSQLREAGVSAAAIHRYVLNGALLVEHRGVYRVGHRAPSTEAKYLAAVLACGPGAVLSGRAAGFLVAVVKGALVPPPEVTLRTERRIEGVRTVRSRGLDPRDTMVWRGIPVTTVARTLVDLAAVLRADALARAVHEAQVRYRTTPDDVEAVSNGGLPVRARRS